MCLLGHNKSDCQVVKCMELADLEKLKFVKTVQMSNALYKGISHFVLQIQMKWIPDQVNHDKIQYYHFFEENI
jgi:hypothetical protein